jgi:hypothetical protein
MRTRVIRHPLQSQSSRLHRAPAAAFCCGDRCRPTCSPGVGNARRLTVFRASDARGEVAPRLPVTVSPSHASASSMTSIRVDGAAQFGQQDELTGIKDIMAVISRKRAFPRSFSPLERAAVWVASCVWSEQLLEDPRVRSF